MGIFGSRVSRVRRHVSLIVSRPGFFGMWIVGQLLSEKTLVKSRGSAHKARKRSEYPSGSLYIWVDETLFKRAQEATQRAEISLSTPVLALLFGTQRQRAKAFESLLKEKQTRNARAQKLRAKARGLLKEAERLEASA